jgi:dTDP-4-dehydrorhamnose 3,5-epimerase|tara:strand:+ start:1234 stop:1782 length:549 start_codon:yes stop_codon:yes gene_type:complete
MGKLIETKIKDLYVIEPKVFEDSRGYFLESFNQRVFKELGLETIFVQDNQSLSQKGVVRGLHYQNPDKSQIKLIKVVSGSILDVAVDIRKESPTYGQHVSTILSSDNKRMFYVPHGFAHGFLTLEDNTVVQYKCSDFYSKEHESGIMWNDKDLDINWGINYIPVVSDKDKNNTHFKDLKTLF